MHVYTALIISLLMLLCPELYNYSPHLDYICNVGLDSATQPFFALDTICFMLIVGTLDRMPALT